MQSIANPFNQVGAAIFAALAKIAALAVFLSFSLLAHLGLNSPPISQNIATTSPQQISVTSSTSNTSQISASTTAKKVVALKSQKSSTLAPVAPNKPQTSTPQPATPAAASINPNVLNTQTRAALVNIFCTTQTGGMFEPISGSGVIIDSRGVILTNAHVAQFFLLQNYPFANNISCAIRTGDPAESAYSAELLYLPPAWIAANASQIVATEPSGTGQYDFAFLLITGSLTSTPLPSSFPNIPLSTASPSVGDQMFLAAYPAGFLSGQTIDQDLYASSAFATVSQLYVFDASDSWVDLFSVPGTIVSQQGSSGGAAVEAQTGNLAGIITTTSTATSTGARDLRAVSLAHIEESLQEFGMGGIEGILSGNVTAEAADFNANVAPTLTAKLEEALKNPQQ